MPTLKNRSRSSTTASSASPASARAKENAGNSMSPADSESGSPSAAAVAAAAPAASATGKRKSRAAAQISDLDRTADTQAGVEAMLELHGGGDDSAEEEKKDDGGGEAEEEESSRKKPRRVRGGAKSAKKKKGKLHRTASDLLDESDDEDGGDDSDDFVQQDDEEEEELDAKMDYDEDAVEADDAPASPEPKARKKKSSKKKSKMEALPPITSPLTAHNHNDPGKPAEAGVIRRVYVENFMCHRKLTVDLCRNVNFIYGQNGSGKVRYVNCIWSYIYICSGNSWFSQSVCQERACFIKLCVRHRDCDTWAGCACQIRHLASSCKHLAEFTHLSPLITTLLIVLSTDNITVRHPGRHPDLPRCRRPPDSSCH